jgi:alkylated DNA repair dioxygenase AlkB
MINPDAAVERIALDDTSWVDVSRGWLSDHDEVFTSLHEHVAWRTTKLFRYERAVEEKRLSAGWRRGQPLPHPSLAEATRWIQNRYKTLFDGFAMVQYRDASDGQGFHRDTDMRWLDDTIIAVLTLGAQRPWLLRPRQARFTDDGHGPTARQGTTLDLSPASGDLLVMGGRSQADWEHSVAYMDRSRADVGVRISLQWRFARKTGEPFMGPSYSADVTYRHGKTAPRGS